LIKKYIAKDEPIPARIPVKNLSRLLLLRIPEYCTNPSIAIGKFKIKKMVITSVLENINPKMKSIINVENKLRYIPKHLAQMGILLPNMKKHLSGI
jgi:hypothetical protein